MNKKQQPARIAILAKHVEAERQKQTALQQFYQKRVQEMQSQQHQLQHLSSQPEYPQDNSVYLTQDIQEQSQKSSMAKSKVLGTLPNPSKIDKNKSKLNEKPVNFENEYHNSVDKLVKVMNSLVAKEQNAQTRKDIQKTKSTSFYNKSMRASKIIQGPKELALGSSKRIKTDRSLPELSKKQRLMLDLGDVGCLCSEDEVINNLLKNLKIEEERYINNVLTQSELSVKQKMKQYMSKQCERYEQALFKIKQEELAESQNKLDKNKQMVRRGYTPHMKQIVEKGLRLTLSAL